MHRLHTSYHILVPMQHKFPYGSIFLNEDFDRSKKFSCRDNAQDSLDLDRIDETRLNNQLNVDLITRTRLNQSTPTIYDTAQNLPICFDVPSGVYIEFGYVRVPISRTVSYERIVSVRYK